MGASKICISPSNPIPPVWFYSVLKILAPSSPGQKSMILPDPLLSAATLLEDIYFRHIPTKHRHSCPIIRNFCCHCLVGQCAVSGPLYPNAPSVLFCTFPRPASPTRSTYLVGCPSPMRVESIELMMSATTELLHLDQLGVCTQGWGRVVKRTRRGLEWKEDKLLLRIS